MNRESSASTFEHLRRPKFVRFFVRKCTTCFTSHQLEEFTDLSMWKSVLHETHFTLSCTVACTKGFLICPLIWNCFLRCVRHLSVTITSFSTSPHLLSYVNSHLSLTMTYLAPSSSLHHLVVFTAPLCSSSLFVHHRFLCIPALCTSPFSVISSFLQIIRRIPLPISHHRRQSPQQWAPFLNSPSLQFFTP